MDSNVEVMACDIQYSSVLVMTMIRLVDISYELLGLDDPIQHLRLVTHLFIQFLSTGFLPLDEDKS